jgi:hypothetical protein
MKVPHPGTGAVKSRYLLFVDRERVAAALNRRSFSAQSRWCIPYAVAEACDEWSLNPRARFPK